MPELHGKLDVLPDGTNTLVLEADEPGEYRGECAEFCGLQHAKMGFLVIAQPRDEFDAWLAAQQQPAAEPASEAARRGSESSPPRAARLPHRSADRRRTTRGRGRTSPTSPAAATLAADTSPTRPSDLTEWLRDPDEVKAGTTMPRAGADRRRARATSSPTWRGCE